MEVLGRSLDEPVPPDLKAQRGLPTERAQVPLLENDLHAIREAVIVAGARRAGEGAHVVGDVHRLPAPGQHQLHDPDPHPDARLGAVLGHLGPHAEVLYCLDAVVPDDVRDVDSHGHLADFDLDGALREDVNVLLRLLRAGSAIGNRAATDGDRLRQPLREPHDHVHRLALAGRASCYPYRAA